MSTIGPEWVQVGELGLAFIVIILCAGLITYVVQTSTRREKELLQIITKVLPVMESMSVSMTNINLRLESIEDNQMRGWDHKAPHKAPRRKTGKVEDTAPVLIVPPVPVSTINVEVPHA